MRAMNIIFEGLIFLYLGLGVFSFGKSFPQIQYDTLIIVAAMVNFSL